MAFEPIDSAPTSGLLPFLNEFIKGSNIKNGKLLNVTEVFFVPSGKGCILTTSMFRLFLWKSSGECRFLESNLPNWVDSPVEGCLVQIKIDRDHKNGGVMGIDKTTAVTWLGKNPTFTTEALF
jgi:hypothetical protein